jgi:hypothetical protein
MPANLLRRLRGLRREGKHEIIGEDGIFSGACAGCDGPLAN